MFILKGGSHVERLPLPGLQVSNMVSRELEKECIVVFDEAHNIDNICIEVGCSTAAACSNSP